MCKEIKPCCTPVAPPWEVPQVIPAQLRRVNNLIFRKIGQIARTNGVEAVTPMHGWIMEYLYRNSDTPVFQRDIEREFSITRSTVTNILQLMERKGYIARQSVEQDARLKQLVLTEKGRQFHENTMLALHQTDEYVAGLLTEEENTELLPESQSLSPSSLPDTFRECCRYLLPGSQRPDLRLPCTRSDQRTRPCR